MSKTLETMVRDFLTLKGAEAYDVLAKRVGNSPKTIRRWVRAGVPNSHAAFQLAKALGCEKDEAIRIANEPHGVSVDTLDAPNTSLKKRSLVS